MKYKYNGDNLNAVLEDHRIWLESNKKLGGRADFEGVDLRGTAFKDAKLTAANFKSANLRGVNIEGANLRGADLRGVDFSRANLRNADLRGADLRGAYFEYANLRSAHLEGAQLEDVYFEGSNLSFTCIKGFYIGKHFICNYNERLKIGCVDMPLEEWASQVRNIGIEYDYTEEDVMGIEYIVNGLLKRYL